MTSPPAEPFSPDAGSSPENGFKTEPFSPDEGPSPENGFKTEPFSPDVGSSPENGFKTEPFSPDEGARRGAAGKNPRGLPYPSDNCPPAG